VFAQIVPDVGHSQLVQPVQGPERAGAVPPGVGEPRVVGHLVRVDARWRVHGCGSPLDVARLSVLETCERCPPFTGKALRCAAGAPIPGARPGEAGCPQACRPCARCGTALASRPIAGGARRTASAGEGAMSHPNTRDHSFPGPGRPRITAPADGPRLSRPLPRVLECGLSTAGPWIASRAGCSGGSPRGLRS
jgi:hypothetical protein